MSGGHVRFTLFYKFRTSKELEILRQSSYMSHILKELSKRNTHIPHIVLFDEDKWQKKGSNAYFGGFRGGGHFWRVTHLLISNYIKERLRKLLFTLLLLIFSNHTFSLFLPWPYDNY